MAAHMGRPCRQLHPPERLHRPDRRLSRRQRVRGLLRLLRRSTDGGKTWTKLSAGLAGHRDDKWVEAGGDPVEPSRLYLVSRSHRLFVSEDHGATWALLDAAAPQYPGRVAVDHAEHSTFYVFGLNGWRRYEGFGESSIDMPTTGIQASFTNFRRTALQDPLAADRFVTGDAFQGFLVLEMADRGAGVFSSRRLSPMIREIEAKVLLGHVKQPDTWFGLKYNMNLYRGCQHRCIYCDSRSECYQIEDFDGEILVKTNAIELLRRRAGAQAGEGHDRVWGR